MCVCADRHISRDHYYKNLPLFERKFYLKQHFCVKMIVLALKWSLSWCVKLYTKWDFWHHFGELCSQLKSEKWQFRIKPHYCPLLGQKSMFMKKHFPIPQKSCIALGTFIFSLLCFSGSFSYILFFNLGIIFWHINLVNFDIDILMAILLLFISYVKWFKKFLVLEKHDFLMFKKTYNSITYSKLPLFHSKRHFSFVFQLFLKIFNRQRNKNGNSFFEEKS